MAEDTVDDMGQSNNDFAIPKFLQRQRGKPMNEPNTHPEPHKVADAEPELSLADLEKAITEAAAKETHFHDVKVRLKKKLRERITQL